MPKPLKIVCISDTHTFMRRLVEEGNVPDGDILIHAGDGTFRGDVKEMSEWAHWMAKLPHKLKLAICGNHDWLGEKQPDLTRSIFSDAGIVYLDHEGVLVDRENLSHSCSRGKHDGDEDILIFGSPYQPAFNGWAFNVDRNREDEGSLPYLWSQIPTDTDVLITHGPVMGRLDNTSPRHEVFGGRETYMPSEHVGCYDLKQRIPDLKNLRLHVSGHVHPGYGHEKGADGVTYVNASACTERYKPINPPIVFDYDERTAITSGPECGCKDNVWNGVCHNTHLVDEEDKDA